MTKVKGQGQTPISYFLSESPVSMSFCYRFSGPISSKLHPGIQFNGVIIIIQFRANLDDHHRGSTLKKLTTSFNLILVISMRFHNFVSKRLKSAYKLKFHVKCKFAPAPPGERLQIQIHE